MRGQGFDIASLRTAYASGASPMDVASEALRRIAAYKDPAVWISRASDTAVMKRARELAALKDQASRLPFYGIPFAIKDNIDAVGFETTAACPAFAYRPESNATVVARLLAAGAILLGKTNLDQFATGLVGTRSPHGAPRSVLDDRYISGGSSSGSAVAVAAGLVGFALGTDTAGSGRVPAAFNDIVGLKPTRGLISTAGVVPACRSLDCVSVLALTTGDATKVLSIAQGFDTEDPFSREPALRPLPQSGFRFGVLADADREFFGNGGYAELYAAAIARLSALGGTMAEIDFTPFRTAARLLYEGPWVAERYAAIKAFIDRHADEMDPIVRGIIAGARHISAADVFEGQYRLAALYHQAREQWKRADLLLLPTVPTHYTVAEISAEPLELNKRLGFYTNFVNLLDCCAIAVPAGFTAAGLPFGVTLIAPAFHDMALAAIADRFHRSGQTGAALPASAPIYEAKVPGTINLLVLGAHLSGMTLNHELQSLGAKLMRTVRTTKDYRLFVLPNSTQPKPGLVRTPGFSGPGIEGEIWALAPEAFGAFVAKIPAPLGVGKVTLDDGSVETAFLCEAYAVEGAREITSFGGWRAYAVNTRS